MGFSRMVLRNNPGIYLNLHESRSSPRQGLEWVDVVGEFNRRRE